MKAIIFDIEGTLVDSVDASLRCWRETLLVHGHDVPLAAIHACSGMDGDYLLKQLVPSLDEAGRKTVLKEQGKLFEATCPESNPSRA